jgi:hypothetical protein
LSEFFAVFRPELAISFLFNDLNISKVKTRVFLAKNDCADASAVLEDSQLESSVNNNCIAAQLFVIN